MPRWLWWAPFGLLTVACAVFGLRLGWSAATLTETEVINHFAGQYIAAHGNAARLSDCVAYPAAETPRVWLVVQCHAGSDDARYDYHVDRWGRLVRMLEPTEGRDPTEPQT